MGLLQLSSDFHTCGVEIPISTALYQVQLQSRIYRLSTLLWIAHIRHALVSLLCNEFVSLVQFELLFYTPFIA